MVEIGASRYTLEKEFDWGGRGLEVGWFRVDGRDTGGYAKTSCEDGGGELSEELFWNR